MFLNPFQEQIYRSLFKTNFIRESQNNAFIDKQNITAKVVEFVYFRFVDRREEEVYLLMEIGLQEKSSGGAISVTLKQSKYQVRPQQQQNNNNNNIIKYNIHLCSNFSII